jgi:hypothetical protein
MELLWLDRAGLIGNPTRLRSNKGGSFFSWRASTWLWHGTHSTTFRASTFMASQAVASLTNGSAWIWVCTKRVKTALLALFSPATAPSGNLMSSAKNICPALRSQQDRQTSASSGQAMLVERWYSMHWEVPFGQKIQPSQNRRLSGGRVASGAVLRYPQ